MIGLLISVLIVLIVLAAVYWIGTILLGMMGAPPPITQIFHVVFVVICVIVLLYFLMDVLGYGGWPRVSRP